MANENVYVGETGAKQLYQRVKGLVSGTIPRVDGAVEGNISVLAGDGSLTDSGISGSSVGDALSKLDGIEAGAQVNVIESVEVAGTALVITGKTVNIPDADVSVKGVVRLTSDPASEEENTAATPEAIRRALANFGGFMVVQLDPATRQPDVDSPSTKYIYLTKEDQSAKTDPYTEWIWIEPDLDEPYWDVIGEASVDLSGYVQKVSGATGGNLGSLTAEGGLADSGISGSSVSEAVSKKHSHANGNVLDQVEEPYTTAEKTKLDGIAAGAQANVIESITADGTVLPISGKTVNISVMSGATSQTSGAIGLVPTPAAADRNKFLKGDATWAELPVATTSADGLMSATDKTKLDGIATGAQENTIETINLGNTELTPISKTVTVPMFDGSNSGAVTAPTAGNANSASFLNGMGDWSMLQEVSDSDIDDIFIDGIWVGGRKYPIVQIGNQLWTAKNLDWKFDGLTVDGEYGVTTPAAWYPNKDESTYGWEGAGYGLLYNAYAAQYMNNNNLLPNGWRAPTQTDWSILIATVSTTGTGSTTNNAGLKLKAVSFGGTDDYGFSMLLPGILQGNGAWVGIGTYVGNSATYTNAVGNIEVSYVNSSSTVNYLSGAPGDPTAGYSIRLVKDIT